MKTFLLILWIPEPNPLIHQEICLSDGVYIIKRKPIEVFEKLQSIPLYSAAVSSITVAELEYGVKKSLQLQKSQSTLDKFLTALTIVDFDRYAAVQYGTLRVELESKGTPIGSLDMLIAAHAKSLKLTLVTNNEREFVRINGLKVENWVNKN